MWYRFYHSSTPFYLFSLFSSCSNFACLRPCNYLKMESLTTFIGHICYSLQFSSHCACTALWGGDCALKKCVFVGKKEVRILIHQLWVKHSGSSLYINTWYLKATFPCLGPMCELISFIFEFKASRCKLEFWIRGLIIVSIVPHHRWTFGMCDVVYKHMCPIPL